MNPEPQCLLGSLSAQPGFLEAEYDTLIRCRLNDQESACRYRYSPLS